MVREVSGGAGRRARARDEYRIGIQHFLINILLLLVTLSVNTELQTVHAHCVPYVTVHRVVNNQAGTDTVLCVQTLNSNVNTKFTLSNNNK